MRKHRGARGVLGETPLSRWTGAMHEDCHVASLQGRGRGVRRQPTLCQGQGREDTGVKRR